MLQPDALARKYRRRGALIDTNLLLLLFVGAYRRDLIGKFKRLNKFVPEDYDVILGLSQYFSPLVTTPNILSEVSNLAGNLDASDRVNCFATFASSIALFTEEYVPSADAAKSSLFLKLGLTDAAIERLSVHKYLVITEDFELSQRLAGLGIDTLNFNHIRYLNWS